MDRKMGLNIKQFKELIVRPVLKQDLELFSESALNLVTGTALVESGLCYLEQIEGPALGPFQMEPATHDDIWKNYLSSREALFIKMQKIACGGYFITRTMPRACQMIGNLSYAAAMCRVFYLRIKESLPSATDAQALAEYHKRYYNTALGKADVERNIPLFKEVINA
ncbi:hypothetical protein FAI40_09980 [Acetobacteraceae bacterium]|nr:hypothetical protein FAI40_09980 [Acetobacteraceae bacterium]